MDILPREEVSYPSGVYYFVVTSTTIHNPSVGLCFLRIEFRAGGKNKIYYHFTDTDSDKVYTRTGYYSLLALPTTVVWSEWSPAKTYPY